jgi:hypothetical protein
LCQKGFQEGQEAEEGLEAEVGQEAQESQEAQEAQEGQEGQVEMKYTDFMVRIRPVAPAHYILSVATISAFLRT